MADEGNVSISLSSNKDGINFGKTANDTFDITADPIDPAVIDVTATTAAAGVEIPLHAEFSTTARWAVLTNSDATDNISIGGQTGGTTFIECFELLPGESMIAPIAAAQNIFCQASANTPSLQAVALEL